MPRKTAKTEEELTEEIELDKIKLARANEILRIKEKGDKRIELEISKKNLKALNAQKFLFGGIVKEFVGDYVDVGLLTGYMMHFKTLREETKNELKKIGDNHIALKKENK